ncbi:MAG: hypothetical protein ACI8XO_000761 [Verrucomicrobiales bacterium]|jgi:hypothetical protein
MVIASFLLIFAVVVFRLVAGIAGGVEFSNFSPMAAIVLCGAAFLPKKYAIAAPLAAMLITDIVLNVYHGAAPVASWMLFTYAAYAAIFYIGFQLRTRESRGSYQWKLFGGAVAGTFLFYLLSNTGAWLSSPAYAKTLTGWFQSQTVGTPGFPASYLFLRNSLVGDLFFTGVFVACFALASKPAPAAQPDLATSH